MDKKTAKAIYKHLVKTGQGLCFYNGAVVDRNMVKEVIAQ